MKRLKALFRLFKTTYEEWKIDGASRLAAALAYYTAFSIAPLLTILIAVIGLVVSEETIRNDVISEVRTTIGADTAAMIEEILANSQKPTEGIIATVLSVGALLLGAIGVFGHLQTALDIIWDVERKKRSGIWGMLRDRLLSFGMMWVIGFLLLVSLVVSTMLSVLDTQLLSHLPGSNFLLEILNFVVSFAVVTMLFAFIYKFLPHVKIAWKDVIIGAAFTAFLFTIGKTLLGIYLGRSGTASTYGAAGAFVLVLLWVYYSAQIVLFGAEFTHVYAQTYGSLRKTMSPATSANAIYPTLKNPQSVPAKTTLPATEKTGKKKYVTMGIFTGLMVLLGGIATWWESRGKHKQDEHEALHETYSTPPMP